ncbi:MAG: hypothetical protein N2256_04780 [Tepidimonas ignava]|nr:hypothetical protein [Tepidimonas ignava]
MGAQRFVDVQQAAILAILGVFLRTEAQGASEDYPGMQEVVYRVFRDDEGAWAIECRVIGPQGLPLVGYVF